MPLAAPAELARAHPLAGLEVESLAPVAPPFSGVVVGEVLESGRQPDAEKISLCQVTTDRSNRLQIVCGAKNVRAGLRVAVATVGAHLPNEVIIKRAKLRGQESNGMLCSARELGLGDEYEGIMELPDSLPLNQDLRAALDLDDVMLEVNATPNRGDCMSVFGIARDYAAAQERRYLTARVAPVTARSTAVFPVTLDGPAGCPVFASRVIRGVKVGAASPAWLRERLRRVGINSISAIVDVTNYVMMDLGQPMHAYDLAALRERITVRMARPGERLTLLDDKEYGLDSDCTGHRGRTRPDRPCGHHGRQSHGDFRRHRRCAARGGALRPRRDCGARAAAGFIYRRGATLRARSRSQPAAAGPRARDGAAAGYRGGRAGDRCRW